MNEQSSALEASASPSSDHSISVRSTWSQVVHQPSFLPFLLSLFLSRTARGKENALRENCGRMEKAVIVATNRRNIPCVSLRGVYLLCRPVGDRARITREKRPIITAVYRLPALTARRTAAFQPRGIRLSSRVHPDTPRETRLLVPRGRAGPLLSLSLTRSLDFLVHLSCVETTRGSFNADNCWGEGGFLLLHP